MTTLARMPVDQLAGLPSADRLEACAFEFGTGYDSYLALDRGRECFWSGDRRGVAALVRRGRSWHIAGGLLAPDDVKPVLLQELLAHAVKYQLTLTFYNIADDDLPLFREAGFQITKWGEEAMVDLADCRWEGKAYEWVRRQSNYCRRQGLEFAECVREEMSADAWSELLAELCEVHPAPLANKPQVAEIRFLEGSFDPGALGRKRIFVARAEAGRGRIEGFLVCNPARAGAMWVVETYRHRPDSPRGTVTFLMHEAMQLLEREGVSTVSLCLVPGLGAGQTMPGDSPMVRRGLAFANRFCNLIFDSAGLLHHKSRFRPRFESRYLCAYPRVTLRSAWSFIRILGVLNLSPRKLLRLSWTRRRKAPARATLSSREA